MALGPLEPVEAPAFEPEPHGLLSSARSVVRTGLDGQKWVQGFRYEPECCYTGSFWDPGCHPFNVDDEDVAADKSDPQPMPGEAVYTPWIMETDVGCNPAGYTWEQFKDRATSRLENLTSWMLEREFWTGTLHGQAAGLDPAAEDYRQLPNFALQDITEAELVAGDCSGILNRGASGEGPWTAVTPKRALSLLIEALSAGTPGGIGFIHTPPAVATFWTTEGSLVEQGDRLMTKVKRHVVVAGGGYPGTGPGGDVPDDDQMWVYATGPVLVRLTDTEILAESVGENFNRRINFLDARAERYAAAYTDPCRVYAVLVDLGA